jgi:hypothetical protein
MTNHQERKSWSVEDAEVHSKLAELMGLSEQKKALLSDLQEEARGQSEAKSDKFYERLLAHENTAEYVEGEDMDERHAMIEEWFVDLFRGQYDQEYVAQRLKIGHVHVQIGLLVRYPLAMIDVIMKHVQSVVAQSHEPEQAKRAFQKVMSLDIAVFNQAYEDQQLEHLAALVGGERVARRLLKTAGLAILAKGVDQDGHLSSFSSYKYRCPFPHSCSLPN